MQKKFMLAFNIPSEYLKKKKCLLSLLKSYDYILYLKSNVYLAKDFSEFNFITQSILE